MDSGSCAEFLAWALPQLGLAPAGFRRVRRQVCKRFYRRLKELRLPDLASYRQRLGAQPDEWAVVARCCHITISRFYRDRRVFDQLARDIMPALAAAARDAGRTVLRVWSAGCASGEEPYTVSLIWRFALATRFGNLSLAVVASDADETVLARARNALYPPGCLAELPCDWVEAAFVREGPALRLRPEYRAGVTFLCQDLKTAAPDGPFDLLLCRNLAFTYFDEAGRRDACARLD